MSKTLKKLPGLVEGFGTLIQEHKLRNGMRVLLAERHTDPVVAAMVFYRVGARNEREDEAGVSHFLEHMMFKGSANYGKGEVDLVTTLLGGSNNAYTTWDHTAYWFELASDRWEKALEIEADRMKSLLLDPDEYEAEKAVVLEELSMGRDDPWRSLGQLVQAALFERHPYRRPIIGYADTLRAMPVETMRNYYERFYHPGNATLVLCGDFEPSRALRVAKKHFGKLPAGPAYEEADCFRAKPDDPRGEVCVAQTWDDSARRLCMAWPTVSVGTKEDHVLDVATMVLTGGRLSRLHRRIVLEKGLATTISVTNDTRIDAGVFWLFAECAQGTELSELEAAIDAELALLVTENITPLELKRAKAMLRASDAYEHETVTDVAEDLGEYAVDANWQLALKGLELSDAITARDVRETAAALLKPERRVIGRSTPAETAKPKPRKAAKSKRKKVKKKAVKRS